MASLQRSTKMAYLRVLVPQDISEDFADAMGRADVMMFTDMNSKVNSFDRPYMRELVRLQGIEQKLKDMMKFLDEYSIKYDASINDEDLKATPRTSHGLEVSRRIDIIQGEISDSYKLLFQMVNSEKNLAAQYEQKADALACVNLSEEMIGQSEVANDVKFSYLSGVISEERRYMFERQVFLATRGNSVVNFTEVPGENYEQDESTGKYVFIVYYFGERIDATLKKLCRFMNVPVVMVDRDNFENTRIQLEREAKELERVLGRTQRELRMALRVASKKLKMWKIAAMQEMGIRDLLNKFLHQGSMLRAEGWCPEMQIDRVQQALDEATRGKGMVPTVVQPIPPGRRVAPTHFNTNKFTSCFQALIDTYGTPRYLEYNPTVPSIITFPFLFAMMYGDIFHGAIVFLGALFIVLREDRYHGKKLNEIMAYLYGGRYLMLFMGMFAVYNGFIYNDCMSISLTLWAPKQYNSDQDRWEGVYPFGFDPSWHGRNQQIAFGNSLKMKTSVLFGVTQMTFGLFLKFSNHVREGDYVTLVWEWIPQMVFMFTFFVYMCVIIIVKWCMNWEQKSYPPPSLITVLVNMVLGFGGVDDQTQLFEDRQWQANLQRWLVIFMMLSIPIMLVMKPIILWFKHRGERDAHPDGYENLQSADTDETAERHGGEATAEVEEEDEGGHGHGHGEFNFNEEFIHQLIHTIEYVLGTVSNTASYLRLWALSLAHAQLSEVFYNKMLLELMVEKGGGISLFIGVSAFIGVTFGVLIVMDQLECFLHALRLHWVEFQNKFFYADGNAFEPFSFSEQLPKEA